MTGDRSVAAAALIGVVTLVGFLAVMVGGGHGSGVRTVKPEPGPASPIGVPRPPVARNVYLAPFGDFPQEDVDALVAHYREKFDLAIKILPSIPIPGDAMDASSLAAYVDTGEPMDKAGAYGIQGFGATNVERIDGDYFAVMGLPLGRMVALMREHGLRYEYGPLSVESAM